MIMKMITLNVDNVKAKNLQFKVILILCMSSSLVYSDYDTLYGLRFDGEASCWSNDLSPCAWDK